jgi:putative glutamine amidotransferase
VLFRSSLEIFCDRFKPDGIVLSGGGNLGEVKDRDETEVFLVNYAKVNNLPLLGICRGMQVLAQLHGVKVELISSHVNSRHRLIATKAENLIPKEVNSFHEYKLLTCPENFEVLALAEDGSIEAIRHKKFPWLGLMWHPERESPFLESDLIMIKNLFRKNNLYKKI